MAILAFSWVRRSLSLLASSFLFLTIIAPGHLQSQQASPPETSDGSQQPIPSLRRETNRVLIDVVVLSSGQSVHGIPKERFHVYEDNQERPILSLEEQQTAAQRSIVAPLALPAGTFSNQPEYPAGMPVNVLLFDGLNTPVKDQAEVRAQMIAYLAQIPPGTPFALYALSTHLQILEGYTLDPAAIAKALKSTKGNPRPSPLLVTPHDQTAASQSFIDIGAQPDVIDRMRQFEADSVAFDTDFRVKITLKALRELARSLAGLPGRKNVIWFSGSFPLSLVPDPNLRALPDPFSTMRDYEEEVSSTNALLGAARIAVYPVDARGLAGEGTFDSQNGRMSSMELPLDQRTTRMDGEEGLFASQTINEHNTLRLLARETGGQAFINTNDFTQAIAAATSQGSNYYTLSFAPRSTDHSGKYHRIKIKIDGQKGSLLYRPGYFAQLPAASPKAGQNLIAEALQFGIPPASQVLFRSRLLPASDPEIKAGPKIADGPAGEMTQQLKAPVQLYVTDLLVDAHTLAFEIGEKGTKECQLEVGLIAYDSSGKRLNYADRGMRIQLPPDSYQKRLTTGIPVRMLIDLPSGPVALRVAVRDVVAGTVGSIQIPLQRHTP